MCGTLCLIGCGLSQEQTRERDEYLYRAQLYFRNNKYPNSLQQLEAALKIDPECKKAQVSKGWTLFFLGRYEEAKDLFEHVLMVDNSDPWSNYGLGSVAFKKAGQTENNLKKLQQGMTMQTAATPDSKSEEAKVALRSDIERLEKERDIWYNRSIKYFQASLRVAPDNYDLYKMLAVVYGARGMHYFSQSLAYFDKFVSYMNKNYASLEKDLQEKEQARMKPALPQKEKEHLDLMIDSMRDEMAQNRKEYRIAQGMAADIEFQIAYRASRQAGEATADQEKIEHSMTMRTYAAKAKQRTELIIKSAPELANQYRNLSSIAKLEGNYDLAAQYLQEYLKHHPLADTKLRAEAKVELERFKQEEQKEKDR
jgi:tetratricopeptide (TPR) repeat protein